MLILIEGRETDVIFMRKGKEKGLKRDERMKVAVWFGSRITSTWKVVGLGARSHLSCCIPDLSELPQTLGPEAGLKY